MPVPAPTMFLLAVSPDGATLLVADEVGQTSFRRPLWALPVLGGSPRRLGATAGQAAAYSPDGLMIAYSDGKDLFTAKSDGAESHKLISLPDLVYDPAWSLDGTLIRFRVGGFTSTQGSLWQVSVDGTNLHRFVPLTLHRLASAAMRVKTAKRWGWGILSQAAMECSEG